MPFPPDMTKGQTQYPCPFSTERLDELYRVLKMTQAEIVKLAAEAMEWDRVPDHKTGRLWLIKAGIRLRTPSENKALRAARSTGNLAMHSPENRAKQIESHRNSVAPVAVPGPDGPMIEKWRPANFGKKASIGTRAKLRAGSRRMRAEGKGYRAADPAEIICSYCKQTFERALYDLKPGAFYCCVACKHEGMKRTETRPCCYCSEPVTRRNGLFRATTWFCNSHCAQLWRWQQKQNGSIDNQNTAA